MSSTFSCALCGVQCSTRQQLQQHETGKRHIANCFRFSVCNGITVVGQDCSAIPELKKLTPVKPSPSPLKLSNSVCPVATLGSNAVVGCEVKSFSKQVFSPFGSNMHYCEPCNVKLNSDEQLRDHLNGQKHLKKVKGSSSASLQSQSPGGNRSPARPPSINMMVPPDLLDTCLTTANDSAMDLTILRGGTTPISSAGSYCNGRTFVGSCRQQLGPIWPGVTFLQHEADTLVRAAELATDCVLRLDDVNDSWFRIGIHLVTAMLTANRDSSCDLTSAIWICPKMDAGPDPSLFRTFTFPRTNQRSIQYPTLRVAQLPCRDNLSEFDLVISDADQFCNNLSEMVLKWNQVCCIIIQDAGALASHFRLCSILQHYIQTIPADGRGRIICFSTDPLPSGCLFNAFRLVHFVPIR